MNIAKSHTKLWRTSVIDRDREELLVVRQVISIPGLKPSDEIIYLHAGSDSAKGFSHLTPHGFVFHPWSELPQFVPYLQQAATANHATKIADILKMLVVDIRTTHGMILLPCVLQVEPL